MFRNALFGCVGIAALAMSLSAQDVDVPGDYATIQEGIDNVGAGGTVFVGPGIYTESLVIDPGGALGPARGQTTMRIEATAPGVVVQWAAGAHSLPAAATSVNGTALDYVLLAQGCASLTLVDLEFTGLNDVTAGMLSCGIVLIDSVVTVDTCFLHDFQESPTGVDDNGIAIRVEGLGSDVDIVGCAITNTQTAYISAVDSALVDILSNQLIGRGPTATMPQRAIVFGGPGAELGAGGTVDGNFIDGFWFTAGGLQAVGVQNYQGGSLSVTNNEFEDCQVGVHDLANTLAINTTIDNNLFTQVAVYTTGVVPTGVIVADGELGNVIVIKDNRFSAHEGPGVYLFTDGASITNNFFNGNGVGFSDKNCQDDGLPDGNSWVGNSYTDYRDNAGWPSYYLIPGLAGAKDWDATGVGEAKVYGLNNVAGSIQVISGRPGIGTTFTVAVDNPIPTTGVGFAVFVISTGFDANYPNGTVIPNYGMDGGDGELLYDLDGEAAAGLSTFGFWQAADGPTALALPIPDDTSLVGLKLYMQGVVAIVGPLDIGLGRALDLTFGY